MPSQAACGETRRENWRLASSNRCVLSASFPLHKGASATARHKAPLPARSAGCCAPEDESSRGGQQQARHDTARAFIALLHRRFRRDTAARQERRSVRRGSAGKAGGPSVRRPVSDRYGLPLLPLPSHQLCAPLQAVTSKRQAAHCRSQASGANGQQARRKQRTSQGDGNNAVKISQSNAWLLSPFHCVLLCITAVGAVTTRHTDTQ